MIFVMILFGILVGSKITWIAMSDEIEELKRIADRNKRSFASMAASHLKVSKELRKLKKSKR